MKVRRLLVLVAVVVAVVGCRGRSENSITGSYGSGMLVGSVVLNGISGSPEGVEVSVRGTGMAVTLGADGRFAFSGVPENAVLDFRRADGIQASLAVNGNGKGSLLVQLGKDNAHNGATRGNKNKDKVEFEGTITAAAAEEITVLTSHKDEILIGLSTETVIRKGNEILEPADLSVDMHVHVRARKVDDKYVAQEVVVQEEDDGGDDERPELREYEGTIVSASATELVVFDSHKQEVTFTLTADTVIRKGNTPVDAADLLPGQRVHVKATVAADGAATAVQVIVQNTHDSETVTVSGTVLGVTGSDIKIKTKTGGEVLVQTNAATRIREKGKAIAVSDVSAGDSLSAKGKKVADNTILASEVEVRSKSGHP